DVRSAAEMNPADDFDRQRHDMFDVTVHQTREAVAHADDIHSFERRANGCRADDAVDTGGGSATYENCQLLMMLHSETSAPKQYDRQIHNRGWPVRSKPPNLRPRLTRGRAGTVV